MQTGTSINYRDLIVSTGDPETGNTLGHLLDVRDSSLLSIQTSNGCIAAWPQLYISAPGEDPAWNTPSAPIDYEGEGFELALAEALAEIYGAS